MRQQRLTERLATLREIVALPDTDILVGAKGTPVEGLTPAQMRALVTHLGYYLYLEQQEEAHR